MLFSRSDSYWQRDWSGCKGNGGVGPLSLWARDIPSAPRFVLHCARTGATAASVIDPTLGACVLRTDSCKGAIRRLSGRRGLERPKTPAASSLNSCRDQSMGKCTRISPELDCFVSSRRCLLLTSLIFVSGNTSRVKDQSWVTWASGVVHSCLHLHMACTPSRSVAV